MYRIGKKYKLELKKGIFYTATVIEEDEEQILIKTIRGEELVLNKGELVQSLLQDE
jgi:predicted Ser/Thr protein kinase